MFLNTQNIYFGSPTDTTNGIIRAAYNSGTPYLALGAAGEFIAYLTAKKVGIGTTTAGDDLFLVAGNMGVTGSLHVSGNISTSGSIIAREFHTEFVSASISYASGSHKFGDTPADDLHRFTGSIEVTSSALTVSPAGGVSGSLTSTGSFGDGRFDNKVGIGTSTINTKLHVNQTVADEGIRLTNAGNTRFNVAYSGVDETELRLYNSSNAQKVMITTKSSEPTLKIWLSILRSFMVDAK